jgi:hypothetical protein
MDKPDLIEAAFRALCTELVEAWDATADFDFNDFGHAAADIVTRARAALAHPEPVAPTDEEIMELMPQQMRDDLANAARAMIGFDNPKAAAACRIILNRHAVDHARAVLARWGTPANNTKEEN